MSILITGIDMQTKGNPITVTIYPDGTAEWEAQHKTGTAVPVPKHGRLIDADALLDAWDDNHTIPSAAAKVIEKTIIPASEEGE